MWGGRDVGRRSGYSSKRNFLPVVVRILKAESLFFFVFFLFYKIITIDNNPNLTDAQKVQWYCLNSLLHLFKGDCSCVPRCRSTAPSDSLSNSTTPTKTPLRSLSTSTTMSTTLSPPTAFQSPMRVSALLFSILSTFHTRKQTHTRTQIHTSTHCVHVGLSRIINVKFSPRASNSGRISVQGKKSSFSLFIVVHKVSEDCRTQYHCTHMSSS